MTITTRLLLAAALLALPLRAATRYIDYAGGNDASAGTSTNAPWQHHPFMRAFTGAYSHTPGDRFIFKGGVTWPNIAFQLRVTAGGTSTNRDYYGIDTNWFTGVSWSRPIFDFEDKKVTNYLGNVDFYQSAAILFDGYLTPGPANISYITFDNIILKRLRAAQGANSFGTANFLGRGWANNITIANCEIRDWDIATITANGQDANSGGIWQTDYFTDQSGWLITNCVLSTAGAAQQTGNALHGWFTVDHCTVTNVSNGILGSGTIINNEFGWIVGATDPIAHENAIYTFAPSIVANNLVHDMNSGASAIYSSPSLARPSGGHDLIYNNVVWNVGAQSPITIDSEQGDLYGLKVGSWCFNNTLLNASGPCIFVGTKAKIGSFYAVNNHCITDAATDIQWNPTYIGTPAVVITNLFQTVATATAQGYVIANLFEPTAGGTTIGNGADLSGEGFNTDRTNALRTVPWDIGAYQFQTGAPPPPPTQTLAFDASAYSIIESNSPVTLTVTRGGATTGTVTVQYGTVQGSAIPLIDYTPASGTLTFTDGVSSQTLTVAILDNSVFTGNRTFSVTLGTPSGASLGTPSSAVVTILEDDPVPPVTNITVKIQGHARLRGTASLK